MMKKLVVAFFLVLIIGNVSGQVQIQKVEASFIANFMRYIKWPQQESMKTFTIGVLGKNQAICEELNKIVNGRNVGFAKIVVLEVENEADLKNCQILFVPKGKTSRAQKLVEGARYSGIMPITEEQSYMPKFSVINFKIENSKLTFQLNSKMAELKQIQISSKLAQMAAK